MKKFLILLLIFLSLQFSFQSSAQNLVPNYSFEATDTCPAGVSSLVYSTYWYSASAGTPDYFDSCATSAWVDVPDNYFGWQQAHTGESYAGFYAFYSSLANYREYAEVHLTSPLVAGTKYYIFENNVILYS